MKDVLSVPYRSIQFIWSRTFSSTSFGVGASRQSTRQNHEHLSTIPLPVRNSSDRLHFFWGGRISGILWKQCNKQSYRYDGSAVSHQSPDLDKLRWDIAGRIGEWRPSIFNGYS